MVNTTHVNLTFLIRLTSMRTKQIANLRVCASCEWIYRLDKDGDQCPKCQFVSYGARFVYGDACYRYEKTQKPWYEKKMSKYGFELRKEIIENNKKIKPKSVLHLSKFVI